MAPSPTNLPLPPLPRFGWRSLCDVGNCLTHWSWTWVRAHISRGGGTCRGRLFRIGLSQAVGRCGPWTDSPWGQTGRKPDSNLRLSPHAPSEDRATQSRGSRLKGACLALPEPPGAVFLFCKGNQGAHPSIVGRCLDPFPPRKPTLMMSLGTISPQASSLFLLGTHFCKMWGVWVEMCLLGAETMMALVSWLPSFIPRSLSNNAFLLRTPLGKAEAASPGTLGTEHRSYAARLSKSSWLGCVPSWGESICKQSRSVGEMWWFSPAWLAPGPEWPTCPSCVCGSSFLAETLPTPASSHQLSCSRSSARRMGVLKSDWFSQPGSWAVEIHRVETQPPGAWASNGSCGPWAFWAHLLCSLTQQKLTNITSGTPWGNVSCDFFQMGCLLLNQIFKTYFS